ncbi:transmembrane and death domain protein 1 isoform X2 [Sparus aurata]|uniref:transmembrane and death domain protein 1 isoform X2 n=1 Tax=Sparus aurata TaxID=8175 RepID=UPI0011C0E08F|nr:uncharacterized protein C12orf81-like isoform X2 [Sparus aurata]
MKVLIFCPVLVFLLLRSALGEDTVAEDIGAHQLERLVELLTWKECRDLLFALSHPEDDILQHLQRLSSERNPQDLKPRARRETSPAAEVGKNINQDKILSLKRYVQGYHEHVKSLNSPPDSESHRHEGKRSGKRRARDLSWRDLDLIVERAPVPQYQKGPLDVALPLLYGILLGFGGTLFAGLAVLLVFLHVS